LPLPKSCLLKFQFSKRPFSLFFKTPLPELAIGKLSRKSRTFPITPQVNLRPDASGHLFVLSIIANDRTGLLYSIAQIFRKHRINLHTAKIMTLGERVEDIFLIDGDFLKNSRNQLQLETDLINILSA